MMPYVNVEGAKIYYEIEGDGEPLLLCHGVRGSHQNWEFFLPHLRDSFQVIMPDSRGHGQSTELTEPSTMDLYSTDMISLLDHLEIRRCIIAGHSMGGFIVQQMALDVPDRIKALILINTAPMVDVEGAMAQIELGKLSYGLSPKEAVLKLLEFEFHDPNKIRNTPGMLDLLFHSAEEGQRLANSHGSAQGACAKFNIQDRVKEIKLPTLVLCGAEDKTFPCRWNKFYAENLPNATTQVIKGTSHSVQLEQPEELAQAIINFTKSL
jgi:pimeloyl-ACP methyl ester carboxylesterase